jgi:hypothetical protein
MAKPGVADIYFSLHKRLFSIRMGGKVVRHCGYAFVWKPKFVVQPAGRAKVFATKRKNVHAFVRGTLMVSGPRDDGMFAVVRYNPYEAGHFMLEDGTPVESADFAMLDLVNGKPRIMAWWY